MRREETERKWDVHVAEADSQYGARVIRSPKFQEFQPVAPRVVNVESPSAGEALVINNFYAPEQKRLAQIFEICNRERWMGFPGRPKILFHANVHLLTAALKPASASSAQRLRLFYLGHSQDRAEEFASRGFAAFGCGDLNVIDARDACFHLPF